ncbi:MAG: 50S ribosomal protein L10 [Simkaniaceae bacterium]|nr:50S ribosomal protein L10 [Simkaniaceae bacterium]
MRKEKQFLLDEIKDKLNQPNGFVITSYQGIDPNTASDFRMSIIDSGGLFCIVKKRVFLKAAKEAGIEIDKEILKGHIGIVYSGKDTIATTKAVYKFKKENDKLLDVLGGQFEGKMCSPNDLKEISALPSQEQMRAEFLGVLEAPLSGLVSVMEGVMTGVVSCMDQQVQKKESEQ